MNLLIFKLEFSASRVVSPQSNFSHHTDIVSISERKRSSASREDSQGKTIGRRTIAFFRRSIHMSLTRCYVYLVFILQFPCIKGEGWLHTIGSMINQLVNFNHIASDIRLHNVPSFSRYISEIIHCWGSTSVTNVQS